MQYPCEENLFLFASFTLCTFSWPLHDFSLFCIETIPPHTTLSYNPSFAGSWGKQIMLIFHLDRGSWSQVFGSSGVFRCNRAGDGTWWVGADEGWGVEDFRRAAPCWPSLKSTPTDQEEGKLSFLIRLCRDHFLLPLISSLRPWWNARFCKRKACYSAKLIKITCLESQGDLLSHFYRWNFLTLKDPFSALW